MEGIWILIVTYLVTAITLIVVVFVLLRKFFKEQRSLREFELRKKNLSKITPAKMQAYERMTIFLERITPKSLLMRQQLQNKTTEQLQAALLTQIRQEWEHNIAQQIYITKETWTLIYNAKESVIQFVNACATKATSKTPAIAYATMLLEVYGDLGKTPTEIAIEKIKNELAGL